MLVVAMLFAARWPGSAGAGRSIARALVVAVGRSCCFELLPAPRPLYSAAVPAIYRHVAAAPADVRVLELPFGIRDGTSSAGNFTARSQFFQTVHGKRLIGGYLSRVSRRRIRDTRRDPMLDALIWLSEGRELDPSRWRSLVETGPAFAERAKVGVRRDRLRRTTRAIREFAIRAFNLQLIESDGEFELYVSRGASDPLKASAPHGLLSPG